MLPHQESAVTQAEGALGLLEGEERKDAEELLIFTRRFFSSDQATIEEIARVCRLVEFLARRRTAAMPYAALGRALLAHLHGSAKDSEDLIREFETKMAMLGL